MAKLIILFGFLVIGWVLLKVKSYLNVPSELKQLHAASFLKYLYSVLCGESFDIRYDNLFRDILEKHGLARIWMQGEWGIVVSDLTLIKEIQTQSDVFLKFSPAEASNHLLMIKFMGLSSVLLADGPEWQRHRRIINPSFKSAFPTKLFGESAQELIQILESSSRAVVIRGLLQRFTLDVLGKGLFSYDFGAVRGNIDEHILNYNAVIDKVFDPIYFMFTWLEYIVPSRLILHHKSQQFRKFLRGIIEQRMFDIQNKAVQSDLLTSMIKDSWKEEKGGLNKEELLNNLATFFIAGHDTTANTLTSVLYYLSLHQDIQNKARDEVLSIMEGSPLEIPSFEQQAKFQFVNQIIKESMRLIPTISIKKRFCNKKFQLSNGLIIPENTNISIHVWAQHRNPKLFPDPESFNPNRFSDPHGVQAKNWMPFGSGSRTCLGIGFSLMEQRIVLAMLLAKFNMSLGPQVKALPRIHLGSSSLQFPQDIDIVFTPLNKYIANFYLKYYKEMI